MSSGPRRKRPCIRGAYPDSSFELHIPHPYCPVCSLWPRVAAQACFGERPFPAQQSERVFEDLRAFAKEKSWKGAELLGGRSVRRGAAREILRSGGTFANILESGQWHLAAFQLYLDLGSEESQVMASILIDVSEDEWSLESSPAPFVTTGTVF